MAEEQTQKVEVTQEVKVSNSPEWLASVAMKKIGWAVAKFAAAKASTPAVIAAFLSATEHLKPYGITVTVDNAILQQTLPAAVFAVLVATHDAAKIKTGWKFL